MAVLACCGYLVHPIKKRHFEKRLIKEKRGVDAELGREGPSWMRDAVLERSRTPELVCKNLEN